MTTTKIINVFTENIYPDWEIDEVKCIAITRKIVEYYLEQLLDISCLDGFDFESLTFDILFDKYITIIHEITANNKQPPTWDDCSYVVVFLLLNCI